MKTSYQQHFFFVLYPSLISLWALFPNHPVHTPGSHFLLPRLPTTLHQSLPISAVLPPSNFLSSCIPLFQPSPPLRLPLSLFFSFRLTLCLCSSPAIFVPFTHCGKTTHYGRQGGGGAVLWSRPHYQQRESWGRWIDGCRGTVGHSYE